MAASKVRDALRVAPGDRSRLSADPRRIPLGPNSRAKASRDLADIAGRLAELQEALYAQGVAGGDPRRVLLVLQGPDTSGKSGTIRHVGTMLNPLGLHIAAFKQPTRAEKRHDYLWRIRRQVPGPGIVGIFDRSHYEDVLVARVESLVPAEVWRGRYKEINDFEAELADHGVTLVKCLLHMSRDEQRKRLLARLDNPAKQWKFNPDDLSSRSRWDEYRQAHQDVLERCSTAVAPWYLVPADRKWYRNWVIARLLLETLTELAPAPPAAQFDVAAAKAELKASD